MCGHSAAADAFFAETLGDAKLDKDKFVANSPRQQASKIKGPLMIVHAVRDQRVPFQHAEGIRDAMRAAGKSVEWVVYADEAHGFVKLENRVDRYNKIEAFLKQNIGQ